MNRSLDSIDNFDIYKKKRDIDIITLDDGSRILDPYNPINRIIDEDTIKNILSKFGLPPVVYKPELYRRAFIHKSYLKRPNNILIQEGIEILPKPDNALPLFSKSNERLELIGDGALEFTIKNLLYVRFPKWDQGLITQNKIKLVKNESIGKLTQSLGLNKWIILSKHAEENGERTNLAQMGCLFEAFVGAIYFDSQHRPNPANISLEALGHDYANTFIKNVYAEFVDWTQVVSTDDNYKNLLQVKLQKNFRVTPHYIIIDQSDTSYTMGVYLCIGENIHEKTPEMATDILGKINIIRNYIDSHGERGFVLLGKNTHSSKKIAEQMSAKHALELL